MNFKKIVLVCFLTSISLNGLCTEAEDIFRNKKQLLNNAWSNFTSCTNSLRSDSDLSYIFNNVIATKDNPRKYELMQSSSFASQEEINHLIHFSRKFDECRNPLKSSLFEVDSNLGSLYTESFNAVDSIIDAYAIRKINLGDLNSKISTIDQETSRSQQEILNNLTNSLNNAHNQESSSNRNRFQNALKALSESLNNSIQHDRQLEIERERNQTPQSKPINTNCYRNGNYVQCTTN